MKELWAECIEWLMAAGVLDVSVGCQLSKPVDLAVILRDGVLLCELALKLSSGCIDRSEMFLQYEENQRSPFMRAKNISLFLDVCRAQFGLTQLFNSNDLYDLEDFGRVLHVISLLSHSQQASSAGLRPFPEASQSSSTDESIYCNLQEEVDKAGNFPLSFSQRDSRESTITTTSVPVSLDDDDHYGFIGTLHDNRNQREQLYDTIVTRGSSASIALRPSLVPKRYLDYKPTNKRGHCIRELLDTEIRYCDMLERFIENFYNKLRYRIGAEDMNAIFINIKDIYHLHKRFLVKLIPAVLNALDLNSSNDTDRSSDGDVGLDEKNNGLHISDIFPMFKLDFIPYAHYCSRLKSSTRYIDDLERSQPEIRKYIAELNSQTQSQFNLRDLLAVPFQRLLKYPLLLKELMDASADVGEQQRIDVALEAMRDVSNYCNEMKRDYEKLEVISIIERSIVCGETKLPTPFIEWCGRLLQDGIIKMVDHDDGTSNRPKQRYAFLFEKNLIVCKQKSNGMYEFRKAYVISEYELPDSESDQSSAGSSRTNVISRKLTATLFDNTTLTLVRRGYTSLIGNGHNTMDSTTAAEFSSFIKRASLSSLNVSATSGSNVGSPSNASVQMIVKSPVQRENWRKMLRMAINLNNPPIAAERGHSLLYKTYTRVTECSICKKLLAGKFYQGYHCSGCGCNLHLECCKLLQYCVARRRLPLPSGTFLNNRGTATTLGRHGNSSGSVADFQHTRTRSHSAIHFCTPYNYNNKFQAGDLVVATRTVVASIGDTTHLSFNVGDLIEIIDVRPENGAISACLSSRPECVGLISVDCIERTSETLRKNAERDRHSAGALNSEMLSPQRLSGTMPTAALPSSSTLAQPLASMLLAPLVSKKIITLSEERGVCKLEDQPWYFGQCTRADADRMLQGTEDGTFLVRYNEDSGRYAISLRYDGTQKHIRIEVCSESGKYYLCDWRFFDTIPELVAYYRETNLDECFPKVHAVLSGTPLKEVLFRALSAYDRRHDNYLSLRLGDVVTVLSTCAEHQGWWLGRVNDRIGYFPLSYIQPQDKDDRCRADDGGPSNSNDSERTSASMDGVGYAYAANGVRKEIQAQPTPLSERQLPSRVCASTTQGPGSLQYPTIFPSLSTTNYCSSPAQSQQLPAARRNCPHLSTLTSLKTEFPSSLSGEPVTVATTTATTIASGTQKYLAEPYVRAKFMLNEQLLNVNLNDTALAESLETSRLDKDCNDRLSAASITCDDYETANRSGVATSDVVGNCETHSASSHPSRSSDSFKTPSEISSDAGGDTSHISLLNELSTSSITPFYVNHSTAAIAAINENNRTSANNSSMV